MIQGGFDRDGQRFVGQRAARLPLQVSAGQGARAARVSRDAQRARGFDQQRRIVRRHLDGRAARAHVGAL